MVANAQKFPTGGSVIHLFYCTAGIFYVPRAPIVHNPALTRLKENTAQKYGDAALKEHMDKPWYESIWLSEESKILDLEENWYKEENWYCSRIKEAVTVE